jgi:hypothetical protein
MDELALDLRLSGKNENKKSASLFRSSASDAQKVYNLGGVGNT